MDDTVELRVPFEGHTITIVAYTSPTDGTPIVAIDTPDIPEDSRGPKIRIWLNDDTVFENPEVPFLV